MSKRLIIAAVAMAALVTAGSASAITNGQHDGNAHPNVGAMMAFDDPSQPNTLQELCSGTLVAPQVFLTAAHCTDYLLNDLHTTDVFVTFNTNSAVGPYIQGTMVQDPLYNGKPATIARMKRVTSGAAPRWRFTKARTAARAGSNVRR